MHLINRNLFLGCLGHFCTHQTLFVLLFTLSKSYGFPHLFYVLIWMSVLMFLSGSILSLRTLMTRTWNINQKFFALKVGPLFWLFVCNSLEWGLLVGSLKIDNALPILHFMVASTAADTLFTPLLSKLVLGRQLNLLGLLAAVLLALSGLLCCEFVLYSSDSAATFLIDPNLSTNQLLSYFMCIFSRAFHALACSLHKRSLLKEAAFDRFKAHKLSPFRRLQVPDLDEDTGEIGKPVASEWSATYLKAQYITQERRLIEKEREQLEVSKHQQGLVKKALEAGRAEKALSKWLELKGRAAQSGNKAVLRYLKEQERVEQAKVDRHRGITKRYGKKLLEKNKEKYFNETLKVGGKQKAPPVEDDFPFEEDGGPDKVIKLKPKKETPKEAAAEEEDELDKLENEINELVNQKRLWAVQMSEEIQELLKDHKFLHLHEHLFDGPSDLVLTHLDSLFDTPVLDFELFGRELWTHWELMGVTQGVLGVPLYMIMNLLAGDNLTSFMGIMDSLRSTTPFNFYDQMFLSRWESVVIMSLLCLLYTLKPLATTHFILSIQDPLTFIGVEILAKVVFIFVGMMGVEGATQVTGMEAMGLGLVIMSQLVYYWASDNHKDYAEKHSATVAVKQLFEYNSLMEMEEMERKLQIIEEGFDVVDVYRMLFDVALANDIRQIDHPSVPSLQFHKLFDKDYYTNTLFWGGSYPRPCFEQIYKTHIVKGNQGYEKKSRDMVIKVASELVYDLSTLKEAQNLWAGLENQKREEALIQADLQSSPMYNKGEVTPDTALLTDNNLLQTQQKLMDFHSSTSSSSSSDGEIDYNAAHNQADDEDHFMQKEDYLDDQGNQTSQSIKSQEEQPTQMLNHTTNQHPEPPSPVKVEEPSTMFQIKEDLTVKEIDKQNEELPALISKSPRRTMKATKKAKVKEEAKNKTKKEEVPPEPVAKPFIQEEENLFFQDEPNSQVMKASLDEKELTFKKRSAKKSKKKKRSTAINGFGATLDKTLGDFSNRSKVSFKKTQDFQAIPHLFNDEPVLRNAFLPENPKLENDYQDSIIMPDINDLKKAFGSGIQQNQQQHQEDEDEEELEFYKIRGR